MNRQFDVVDNPNPSARGRVPFLLILQSHHLHALDTVIVAPLIHPDLVSADNATSLAIEFKDEPFTLVIGALANLPTRLLGQSLGDLRMHDYEIRRALDRLFTGF